MSDKNESAAPQSEEERLGQLRSLLLDAALIVAREATSNELIPNRGALLADATATYETLMGVK